jgi:hypothetical protein
MNKSALTALVLTIALGAYCQSIGPDVTFTKQIESGNKVQPAAGEGDSKLFSSDEVVSVKNAFLFSLILPGSGEFYAKSYIKAGVFFGIEAACWGGFFYYSGKYSDQEAAFQKYADTLWNKDSWLQWYDTLYIFGNLEHDEDTLGIELLPSTKTQQYYEMIGKYDWFALGWHDVMERDDYNTIVAATWAIASNNTGNASLIHDQISLFLGDSVSSPERDKYMTMREDANAQYSTAKYFIGAIILNHVLSSFDAAWTAKRHNDKLYQGFTGIRSIDIKPTVAILNGNPTPRLNCIITF